eukprot:NODE_429_length_7612_cov_0.787968.p3 type:complete len:357 gc:universal NODE_429_length_7612_cov_0.787968:3715-2645(-)
MSSNFTTLNSTGINATEWKQELEVYLNLTSKYLGNYFEQAKSISIEYTEFFMIEFEDLFAYTLIFVSAIIPIYIACSQKKKPVLGQSMTTSDALWFPITASITLFGLYIIFSVVDINTALKGYFTMFGTFATWRLIEDTVGKILIFLGCSEYKLTYSQVKKDGDEEIIQMSMSSASLLLILISLGIAASYFIYGHWILSNILAFAFSVQAIALLDLDSVKTGILLMWGLFFYDIFWVFGTDVMVSVATKVDGPIKLQYPRKILEDGEWKFALLGLGDIVIPGVFIALCKFFDRVKNTNRYFITGLFAYVLGLGTTIYVMHTYKHAQVFYIYLACTFVFVSCCNYLAMYCGTCFWPF